MENGIQRAFPDEGGAVVIAPGWRIPQGNPTPSVHLSAAAGSQGKQENC